MRTSHKAKKDWSTQVFIYLALSQISQLELMEYINRKDPAQNTFRKWTWWILFWRNIVLEEIQILIASTGYFQALWNPHNVEKINNHLYCLHAFQKCHQTNLKTFTLPIWNGTSTKVHQVHKRNNQNKKSFNQ